VRNKRVKAYIIAPLTILVILGAVFFLMRPQRDPQLVGGWWQFDGLYTLWLHADGSGRMEPDVPSITWRTRGGRLIITSMGVERHYDYSISDDIKLILVRIGRDGRSPSTMHVRVGE